MDLLRAGSASRSAPWVVFAAALAARLILGFAFLHPTAPVTADALYYDAMARAILERGALVSPTGELTASRMPGYPLFLAAIYALGGTAPVVPRLVQVVLGSTGPVALFLLARVVFGAFPAVVCGALAAIDPFLIFYDYQLWTESLGITAVSWALWFFAARVAPNPSPGRSAAGGVLAGLATYVRPDLVLLVASFGTWALAKLRPWRRTLISGTVMGLSCVAMLTPWIARNAVALGHFVPLTTESGFIMWQANNEDILRDPALYGGWLPWPGNPDADYFTPPDLSKDPRFTGYVDEVDLDRRLRANVFEFWREHWRSMPGFILGKWTKLLAISPGFPFWPRSFVWLSRLWYGFLLSAFAIGVGVALARRKPVGILLAFLGWFLVRVAIFMSVFRYRLQIEPIFLTFGAFAIASAIEWLAERRAAEKP
ncbi:MAG: glycosyltransferase family 39 protein [Deltaproteobacteria bacterium]|nr:glycosyltransferase family 39 protein [Deltaproteobacteria bacterium]